MFNPSFRKGMSVTPQVFRNITEEKMAAPNNAYYVLTQAHAGLPNSVLFDTAFAGKTTDDLLEGSTNLYYLNSRVKTYADTLYSILSHIHDDRYFTETEIATNYVPYTGAGKDVDLGNYYLTTGVVKIGLVPGETWTYGAGTKLQIRHKEDGTALVYPIQICAGGDTSQCGGYIQWQYPLGTMVWMAGASSSNNFTIRQDNDSYRLLLNHISGDYGSTYLCSDGSKGSVTINGSGKARDGGGGFRVYAGQSTSPALWFRVYSSSNSPLPTAGSTMVWDLDIGSNNILIRQSKTPASAGASGTAGTICWDSDYIYVCVATNTWKRAAISSW